MSETVLFAEAKMGKLIKGLPKDKGGAGFHKKNLTVTIGGNSKTEIQKTGIKANDRLRAKILADNEDAIKEVVVEEVSKGNIPTREKVLRK